MVALCYQIRGKSDWWKKNRYVYMYMDIYKSTENEISFSVNNFMNFSAFTTTNREFLMLCINLPEALASNI